MLIRGDARHLPLQDQSVHCVVTSPPYYGLRSYATGYWDGGDVACTHKRPASASSTLTSTLGGSKRNVNNALAADYADVCGLCGAVRVDLQVGLEASPEAYVTELVAVFREVWRVLRDDGTVWLNLGDSYSRAPEKGGSGPNGKNEDRWGYGAAQATRESVGTVDGVVGGRGRAFRPDTRSGGGKPKDLVGIPWRVALALQDDGWYLRSDIIWHAPNKMPESVTDRPTKAHEYVFLLAKSARYYYDWLAIAEPYADSTLLEAATDYDGVSLPGYEEAGAQNPGDAKRSIIQSIRKNIAGNMSDRGVTRTTEGLNLKSAEEKSARGLRNKRTVWSIATRPYAESHFATFPPALVEPCILAGTSGYGCCAACGAPWERVTERVTERGTQPSQSRANLAGPQQSGIATSSTTLGWQRTCACATVDIVPPLVLDPFIGSGTVGAVAERFGRHWVGVDLAYQDLATARTAQLGLPFLSERVS